MEPAMSALGCLVYGSCHHEPLCFDVKFNEQTKHPASVGFNCYIAAQFFAHRMFVKCEYPALINKWKLESVNRITSFAYWGTGEFSRALYYPESYLMH